jgi:hypothetical protein
LLRLPRIGLDHDGPVEALTLTPERFNLTSDPPTVTSLAGYAKNRREAIQPFALSLADRLAPWLATKTPGRPAFDGMTDRTAEMLRADLEAAEITFGDGESIG